MWRPEEVGVKPQVEWQQAGQLDLEVQSEGRTKRPAQLRGEGCGRPGQAWQLGPEGCVAHERWAYLSVGYYHGD